MSESVSKRGSKIGGPEDWLGLLSAAGLKERILFTVTMIVLYRIGVHIPIPGVDPGAFTKHPELAQNLLGMIDLFTGGALNKLSVFSMGIGPYITSSIVMQLMTVVIPKLENLQKEQGEQGRRQLAQISRMVTVGLAIFQSFMLAQLLSRIPGVVIAPGPLFLCTTTLILTACAVFIMWMGEMITERGVGNGASLLIFLGIAARLPVMIKNTIEAVQTGQSQVLGVVALLVFFLLVVAFIVRLQQGVRKVMVLGSRRNVGRQIFAAPDDYMYLPVNPSGVMAIIFASSLMMFPSTVMQFLQQQKQDPGQIVYNNIVSVPGIGPAFANIASIAWVKTGWEFVVQETNNAMSYYHWEHSLVYFILILFFAFFYSSIVLPVRDMSDNLRRSGRAIQHVRPGRPTTEFLEKTLNRLTFIGATSVAIIAIAPIHVEQATMVTTLQGLGSTSLIILVGVAIDTQRQILTHALSSRYQARGLFRNDKKDI
ncbi:MAG: preprotein translocase subunit SecY [Candidatus Obscuribacter sp.]|nr:preprotein translocase subunit SecY [Candidatus Obscuribacter sp.]MBL0188276.1 preprotein translocase subunit SecY [Candidatus Obscuribacter sp.]MBP6349154.1 preprotein translocase subunit SecY [Candidatus Obscuribacter sp.]MBP6593966.1 preprotein translocase subunit SecY [Candidatus Obscuribacter sp.]MBP7575859.1 preprotein translocase subunit SecY [Candidatus Obscuribacter sp.]